MKFLINELFKKALNVDFLDVDEGLFLYKNTPLSELMWLANELKKKQIGNNKVGWIIDRNVNITNICVARCQFCNFYRQADSPEAYITNAEQYKNKIAELFELGGNQLLLQGGLHPKIGLEEYAKLFRDLKQIEPKLKLHALGPAEIEHISRLDKKDYTHILSYLRTAGLDSLPGAGAEILTDRVRKQVSRGKCTAKQWLDVMRAAHKLDFTTSATMMFGHVETLTERIEHLAKIREVQAEKPKNAAGFVSFIPWPFQDEGTQLQIEKGVRNRVMAEEYIRIIAISRIMLPNVKNIQASWLTVGKETAQLCLHAGANDFGSIMIEENVVSAAGASHKFDAKGIQQAIIEAGFTPYQRNQNYTPYDGN